MMGGGKLEAMLNCGPPKTFLWLPFFSIDNRKLFCLCCFLLLLVFFFVFLFSFWFVLLEWGKRDFILLFHSVILEMVLQFLLKIIIYLLYNFGLDIYHKRDFSYTLKCCF